MIGTYSQHGSAGYNNYYGRENVKLFGTRDHDWAIVGGIAEILDQNR